MGWYHTAGTSRVEPPTNTQASPPDTYLRATFHPKLPASALSQRRVTNTPVCRKSRTNPSIPFLLASDPSAQAPLLCPAPGCTMLCSMLHLIRSSLHLTLPFQHPLPASPHFPPPHSHFCLLKNASSAPVTWDKLVVQRISMSSPRLSLASWQHSCTFWGFTSLSA